jgi:predicted permease
MRLMDAIYSELRTAVRSLRRTPGLTAAALVTLALGIGVTTAVFSLFQAVLLRQLPVTSPDALYFVAHGVGGDRSTSSHYPWFDRVRQHSDVFAGVTAYNIRDFKVSTGDEMEGVVGQYVAGNFHAVVGAPLQLGRGLSAEGDRASDAIAVISDRYWVRRFNRSPDVIGKSVVVGHHPVTIVGVTSPGFEGLQPGRSIEITLPLSILIRDDPGFLTRTDTWTSMPLVARLRSGVVVEQGRRAIADTYRDFMARPENLEFSRNQDGQARTATLQSAAQGADRLRREYERPLRILMARVAVVLLISCVNIANLLLARAPSRARDVAVRMSMGAGRTRIARGLFLECVLLALCGGMLGLLVASWAIDLVSVLLQTAARPVIVNAQPDGRVLLFAIATSLATGIAFGLVPAWKTTAVDVAVTLKASVIPGVGGRLFGQRALVATQIALCLVLIFGAGLLARTLRNLRGIDAGFEKSALVLFELDARDTAFPPERVEGLCGAIVSAIGRRPDVRTASCSTMSPIANNAEGRAVIVPGLVTRPGNAPVVLANSVDSAYFETFSIETVRGRTFTSADGATTQRVGVLNESMARYYFGDADPIGRSFHFGRTQPGPPITIVGVVRDARQQLRDAPPHMAYTPLTQRDEPANGLLASVRTTGDTSGVAASVRDAVRGLTREVAVSYVRTMDEQIGAALVIERLVTTLSTVFAVLAVVLACVGLYGVMSYDVARRSRDIAIRLALGATRVEVLQQVLRQASIITLVGMAVGLAAAVGSARLLSSLLFGLAPDDLPTLSAAAALLGATALVAGYLPARRAAHVDPAVTLRTE